MAEVAYKDVLVAPPRRPIAGTALSNAAICNSPGGSSASLICQARCDKIIFIRLSTAESKVRQTAPQWLLNECLTFGFNSMGKRL
jgi:hypothetical protein